MLTFKVGGRSRIAAALAVSLGMVATAGAVTTGPAQSVPAPGDCASTFPVADVAPDQIVHGLTVERGTTPDDFTGEVIAVVHDGIGLGKDMVVVKLESDALTRAGGVWSGMSGSPVYAADDRLIGAVAYGLSFGPSMIAGVTPYEYMDDYMSPAAPAARVDVGRATASRIAAESAVTQSQAADGFSWLRTPKYFSGVPAYRLADARQAPPNGRARRYVTRNAATMGISPAAADATSADDSTLVAGGNLGATFAYGAITAGGVGTVTSVCAGRLVGFGHPMMFSGRTTLSMHPASAVLVHPETLGAPFKMGEIGDPVGTITDDRLTGISGVFGEPPATINVTSALSYLARSQSVTTHVSVPAASAEMTLYEQLANHDAVFDAVAGGSELQDWKITGTDHGAPFKISHKDRYVSASDIAFESPWDVADAVWALSRMPGVVVGDVTINGVLVDDNSTWRVTRIEQNRGGRWVPLDRRHPALAWAGGTLRVRALLESGAATRMVALGMPVPARSKGMSGLIAVGGGGSSWFNAGRASSVAQLKRGLSTMARNDAVEAQLMLEGRRGMLERRAGSAPADKVVQGQRLAGVIVR
jgi:SpoIVB peptidase S55